MDILDTMQISASGLTAERVRLQSVASNLANARTTRTEDGGPYQRRVPIFQSQPLSEFGNLFDQQLSQVSVSGVHVESAEGKLVYEPGHPDADLDGYVRYPEIDILREMVDLMNTSRTYEANAQVLDTTRALAMRAIELGR